jgi:hypothetical protein
LLAFDRGEPLLQLIAADLTISPPTWGALRFGPLGPTPATGMVDEPSSFEAWLLIALVFTIGVSSNSQGFSIFITE